MTLKRVIVALVVFAVVWCALACATVADANIKAFSLREANRLLKEGGGPQAELQRLGGITRFVGMVFDRDSADVILVGKVRGDQPGATIDDLIVALRCRLLTKEDPLVSIDPVEETATTGRQEVRFEGGIQNTQFGADFLHNDILLKRYSLDLMRRVGGIESYLRLYEAALKQRLAKQGHTVEVAWLSEEDSKTVVEHYTGKAAQENHTIQSRFWFCVDPDRSGIVESDDVFVIQELQLRVEAELISDRTVDSAGHETTKGEEEKDEVGEEFAARFTQEFQPACAEYPKLKRLKVLFDLAAIAEGIAHLGGDMPNFDYMVEHYRLAKVDTPETYDLVGRVGVVTGAPEQVTLVQLSGGIKFDRVLRGLEKGQPGALRHAVVHSRPNERALCWDLPLARWEMPNDEPGGEDASSVSLPEPEELGFALNVDAWVIPAVAPTEGRLKFRGFPARAP